MKTETKITTSEFIKNKEGQNKFYYVLTCGTENNSTMPNGVLELITSFEESLTELLTQSINN